MAATIVKSSFAKLVNAQDEYTMTRLSLLCTTHTDGSLSVALGSDIMRILGGNYIYAIKSTPGGTAVDGISDLEITDADGLSILGSNGTGFIHTTSTLMTLCYNSFLSINQYYACARDETLTFAITGNTQSGALVTLDLYLTPTVPGGNA